MGQTLFIMKTTLLTILIAGATLFASCETDSIPEKDNDLLVAKERKDIPLTRSEAELTQSNAAFALELFAQTCRTVPDKNVLASPLSTATLLTVLANGAAGETADEINQTLMQEGYHSEEIAGYYSKLATELPELDNTVTLESANAMWLNNGFRLNESFADFSRSYFDTDISVKDFSDPQTVTDINQWAAEKTNGCIPAFLDSPLEEQAQAILANALYFNGAWSGKFDTNLTSQAVFHGSNGDVETDMMQKEGIMPYAKDEYFTAIDLPYGNGAFSMLLLLPDERLSMDEAIGQLDIERWGKLTRNALGGHAVQLKLPKFTLTYNTSLIEVLKSLGIRTAFGPKADFTRMSSIPLYLNECKQKVQISLNESGTEAAVVTWATLIGSTGNDYNPVPVPVSFDRPFLFAIREQSTGVILMMGKVENLVK